MLSDKLKERRITVANIADATCLSRPTIYSYIDKYDDGDTKSLPDYIPSLFDTICDIYTDDFIRGLLKIVHDEVTNPEYVKKKDRKGSESPDIDHAEAERVASDMEDHRQSIDGLKMKNVILDNTIESRSGIPATELDRLRVEYDDRKAEIIKLEDELNELKRHHDELIGHGTERPVMSLKDLITHTDQSIKLDLDAAIEEWDYNASSPRTISHSENEDLVEDSGRYMVLTHDNESEKTVLGLYVNLPGTDDLELIGIYESQKNRRFIVIDDIVSGFDYYYRLYTESDGGRSEVSRFWRLQNPKKGC